MKNINDITAEDIEIDQVLFNRVISDIELRIESIKDSVECIEWCEINDDTDAAVGLLTIMHKLRDV